MHKGEKPLVTGVTSVISMQLVLARVHTRVLNS